MPSTAEPDHGDRRRPDRPGARRGRAAASTCSPASTTRSRSSTRSRRRRSAHVADVQPRAAERGRRAPVPLRRVAHARATATRPARAATSSATSTAWRGISATRTARCTPIPGPFDGPARPAFGAAGHPLPPDEGPDDDAEPARHGEPRPDALARRPHRRQRRRRARSRTAARSTRSRRSRSSRPAFPGLLGRSGPIDDDGHGRRSPTSSSRSPIRRTRSASLDNSLTPEPAGGARLLLRTTSPTSPAAAPAQSCHALDPQRERGQGVAAPGFFGTDGRYTFDGGAAGVQDPAPPQPCTRRSACSGWPDTPVIPGSDAFLGDQVRGFGFNHDGSHPDGLPLHQRHLRRGGLQPVAGDSRRVPARAGRRAAEAAGRGVPARLRQQPGAHRRAADDAHRRTTQRWSGRASTS